MMKFYHPFHLVTYSPWPLLCSFQIMFLMLSMLKFFNQKDYFFLIMNLFSMILVLYQWWRDVIRESTYQGFHTIVVLNGLKYGMYLFITSEIMFFISFFWGYFHVYLSVNSDIGMNWIPKMIFFYDPMSVPLFNTLILLTSGMFITWCHFFMFKKNYYMVLMTFFCTIFLGLFFTFFQYLEYKEGFFSINDSVFGSIFFMLTGFHGLHVIIGTMFMLIKFLRLILNHFSKMHHLGFEFCAWYWHFVDVVWLFLYLFIYWLPMM